MKLGISTSCFYPLETEQALEYLGKNNIKNAEIFFNSRSELKAPFIDILSEIKNRYDMNITSIHPTLSLAESFMMFSAYERRFYDALDDYSRYSEIAAEFGARYIILHGGKQHGVLNDEEYCERYMALKKATLKNGVTVLQENVFKHRAGDFEFLSAIKNHLGDDAEFCLDIKQAIRCGYSPITLMDELGDNIKHYHISDHSPASDCQLPLNGGFNFQGFFEILENKNFNGSCIIEVYNNAYSDYQEIIKSKNLLENLR